jgi:hypothetical protein
MMTRARLRASRVDDYSPRRLQSAGAVVWCGIDDLIGGVGGCYLVRQFEQRTHAVGIPAPCVLRNSKKAPLTLEEAPAVALSPTDR